jgi:arabinofuranosyltransferase
MRLLLHFPILLFAVMAWSRRWMSDDGFINLRIVRHFLAGHGLVFNVGERVEAGTSPLWLFWLSFLGFLGVPLENAAVYSGIFFATLGLLFGLWGALTLAGLREWKNLDRWEDWTLPLGAAVFAVLPPAWDFASSGLETGLSLAWMGGLFWLMARFVMAQAPHQTTPSALPGALWRPIALLLGLGPLIRPELALYSISMGLVLLFCLWQQMEGRKRWKAWAQTIALIGLFPLSYQLFRMGYFAGLTPNTALAKEAFQSYWRQGVVYFENFFSLYNLLVPLSLLFLFQLTILQNTLWRREWKRLVTFAIPIFCGLIYTIYVMKVGGGFMHGRMFLPAVFSFLLPVSALAIRVGSLEERQPLWRWTATMIIVLWLPVCGIALRVKRANVGGIGDERGWYSRQARKRNPIRVTDYKPTFFYRDAMKLRRIASKRCSGGWKELTGKGPHNCRPTVYVDRKRFRYLRQHWAHQPLRPGAAHKSIVMVTQRLAIGIRGLLLPARIHLVDGVGLADPLAARLFLKYRSRPGHEKFMWNWWMVARFTQPSPKDAWQVKDARKALQCGLLKELLPAVTEPVSWSRFWKNVRLSFSLHRLRIPRDPRKARKKFCGR